MTRFDAVLVGVLVVLTACTIPAANALAGNPDGVVIIRGPEGESTVSLERDGRIDVTGRLGTVLFEVADGRMRCTASSCPDKVCVRTGALSGSNPIVCAPNGVVAVAAEAGGGSLDAVSR